MASIKLLTRDFLRKQMSTTIKTWRCIKIFLPFMGYKWLLLDVYSANALIAFLCIPLQLQRKLKVPHHFIHRWPINGMISHTLHCNLSKLLKAFRCNFPLQIRINYLIKNKFLMAMCNPLYQAHLLLWMYSGRYWLSTYDLKKNNPK